MWPWCAWVCFPRTRALSLIVFSIFEHLRIYQHLYEHIWTHNMTKTCSLADGCLTPGTSGTWQTGKGCWCGIFWFCLQQVGTHEMVYWETNLRNCFTILDTEQISPKFPPELLFLSRETWTEGNGSIRAISDHFFLCRCCLRYLFPSLPLFLDRSIWICTPLFGSFIKFRFSDVQCLGSAVFSHAHQLSLPGIAVGRRQRALGT